MSARDEDARLRDLEARLGYRFSNAALLREALTHGSALDQNREQRSYDRLEFLGDRVLGLIVAERLLADHGDEEEGEIAPRFNALVNRQACARAARAADLGSALSMSPSEAASGGRNKEAILADVCESVIGALFLDSGGIEAPRVFVERFWGDALAETQTSVRDAKSRLQEWAAAKKRGMSYVVIEQTGPEHAPHFVVDVRVDGFAPTRGEGASKREAQRAAAAAFLMERGVDG
jgi:ribonuclease-3